MFPTSLPDPSRYLCCLAQECSSLQRMDPPHQAFLKWTEWDLLKFLDCHPDVPRTNLAPHWWLRSLLATSCLTFRCCSSPSASMSCFSSQKSSNHPAPDLPHQKVTPDPPRSFLLFNQTENSRISSNESTVYSRWAFRKSQGSQHYYVRTNSGQVVSTSHIWVSFLSVPWK